MFILLLIIMLTGNSQSHSMTADQDILFKEKLSQGPSKKEKLQTVSSFPREDLRRMREIKAFGAVFSNIPDDSKIIIMKHLENSDLYALSCTSKSFYECSCDKWISRAVYTNEELDNKKLAKLLEQIKNKSIFSNKRDITICMNGSIKNNILTEIPTYINLYIIHDISEHKEVQSTTKLDQYLCKIPSKNISIQSLTIGFIPEEATFEVLRKHQVKNVSIKPAFQVTKTLLDECAKVKDIKISIPNFICMINVKTLQKELADQIAFAIDSYNVKELGLAGLGRIDSNDVLAAQRLYDTMGMSC